MTEKGRITCQVENAPYSGVERKVRKPGDRKSVELENSIKQTFEAVVHLELYPQSDISFIVHIFASDGSLECAVFNACTMALMDAGISMSDMIVACSVGSIKQRICLDLSQVSYFYCPPAYMPFLNTIFELLNRLSSHRAGLFFPLLCAPDTKMLYLCN